MPLRSFKTEPLRVVVSRSILAVFASGKSDLTAASSFSVPSPNNKIPADPQVGQFEVDASVKPQ